MEKENSLPNRSGIIPLSVFLIVIVLDLSTKYLAKLYLDTTTYNYGIIFGLFSHTNEFFRVLMLSFIGIFFASIYFFLIYILNRSLVTFKVFLSLFFGGIVANLTERTVISKTTDFISLESFGFNFIFNFADCFIWTGVILIIIYLFKYDSKIWFSGNRRNKILVNPKEQIHISIKFLAIYSFSFILFLSFSTTYITIILKKYNIGTYQSLILEYSSSFLILFIIISVYIFFISLYFSKEIFGPLKAFESYIKTQNSIEDKNSRFQLREKDRLKELEELAKIYYENLKK